MDLSVGGDEGSNVVHDVLRVVDSGIAVAIVATVIFVETAVNPD